MPKPGVEGDLRGVAEFRVSSSSPLSTSNLPTSLLPLSLKGAYEVI
jgi:hypothetical protein